MEEPKTHELGPGDHRDGIVRFALIRTFATKGVVPPAGGSQQLELDLGDHRAAVVQLRPDIPSGLWTSSNSGDAVLGEEYSFSFGQASSEDLPHDGPYVVIESHARRDIPEADWEGAHKFGFSGFSRTAAIKDEAYVGLLLQTGHIEGLLAIGIGPQLVWTRVEERFAVGWRGEWSVHHEIAPMTVTSPIDPDLASLLGKGGVENPPPEYALAMHWWMNGQREAQEVDQFLAFWTSLELFLGAAAHHFGRGRLQEKFSFIAETSKFPGWESDIKVFDECRRTRNCLLHDGNQRPFLSEGASQRVGPLRGLLWKYLRPAALGYWRIRRPD